MRVEELLKRSADLHREKVAMVAGARRLTFRELDAASDQLAHALLGGGVSRGERVVIFADNSWEAVVGIFATLKAGAVFTPINPSTKSEKLAYVINNCRAAAILTQARLLPIVAAALKDAPSISLTIVSGADQLSSIPSAMRLEDVLDRSRDVTAVDHGGIDLDLAMLIYTSGSTGLPKGVMMTHQNIVAAATSITTYLKNTPDDVILNVLPISFDYGLYQVLMAAMIGATLVLEKSFAFPNRIFDKIAAERVTGLPIVPTIASIILQMRDLRGDAFPSLRYITNTAAALPPSHIERLQDLFPQAQLFSMYGLTECKRCTWLPPSELRRRPGSVGIAIPNTEAYVVGDDGTRCGPGITGELVIRGAHVMKGYWENPSATDQALRQGPHPWEKVLHTGDLFRTDQDGFLYFVARKDDIIKSRGEKVSPVEVENVLYRLRGIREAAVVGIPDPIMGMAIKAVVAVEDGSDITAQTVMHHCAQLLEDFMVPKLVEIRDALPKGENGKIIRRAITAEGSESA
jgi:long-chain acyl-CoA synthetase